MTNLIETLKANSLLIIFIIMFLESLNLTGIPAIVIIPAIGVFIKNSGHSFFVVFAIASFASILGSIAYYLVSSKFGDVIYNFFFNKFPSTQKSLTKAKEIAEQYGAKMCLIGRMIPTVRTFISLMSGIFKVKFKDYIYIFFYWNISMESCFNIFRLLWIYFIYYDTLIIIEKIQLNKFCWILKFEHILIISLFL